MGERKKDPKSLIHRLRYDDQWRGIHESLSVDQHAIFVFCYLLTVVKPNCCKFLFNM